MNKYATGNNVKRHIKMQHRTLDGLADDIGVGHDTMSQWVNGRRQVTAYGLYRISKALGVTMEELMEGVEDE